jgi:hypothetical protein
MSETEKIADESEELDRSLDETAKEMKILRRWRGVVDPCLCCGGTGTRYYNNTSTWRGGIGGASITRDVCDACWGSGDRYRGGVDLRRLRDEEAARVAAAATSALARAAGLNLTVASVAITELAQLLREAAAKADRGRNPRRDALCFAPIARSLASILDKGVFHKEKT